MTALIQMETAIPNIFEILANGFKDMKKEMLNKILMSLIYSMKKEHEELKKLYEEIQRNNDILLDMNLEDFYDTMLQLEDNFKQLLKLAQKHKDKSDMFMQFYKTIDELYGTVVYVNIEVGFLEAELKHPHEIKNAS